MPKNNKTKKQLELELQDLRARLDEAARSWWNSANEKMWQHYALA